MELLLRGLQEEIGRQSDGLYAGIAPGASFIVVKLGEKGRESFARTTEIMRALKFVIDTAESLDFPISINLSFGTNNGSHDGRSLFETYIDSVSQRWKTVVSIATGNEGNAGHHYAGVASSNEIIDVRFVTSTNIKSFYISLWKNFVDDFSFELITPSGKTTAVLSQTNPLVNASFDNMLISMFYTEATHYNVDQEAYFYVESKSPEVPVGVWNIKINTKNVIDGRFNIWLPTVEEVSLGTSFTNPNPLTTLTLPSTSLYSISVGAYNPYIKSIASFSGLGYTRNSESEKPDLVAPGVDVITTIPDGKYDAFSGTSIASPFVAGAAALMMEWGIIKGNDPFLYGQRAKAFLRKGAVRFDPTMLYPNPYYGFGSLCISNTMNLLIE